MKYRWRLVAMLWGIAFFNYADRQAIFSVFPLLERELKLNSIQLGLLGSAFAWVYGLGGCFAGYIVDRVSRKKAVLGGLYAWSLICMATAWARNFPALFVLRAAEGLGETFYFPASMSMLSAYHGAVTRSRAIGLHQTSVYAGTIVGSFFAGWIGQSYGWRWSFLVFGGLGVLLGLVLTRGLREPVNMREPFRDQAKKPMSLGDFLRLLQQSPAMLCLMGAFLCSNFVAVVLLTWMPKFLYDRYHLTLAMAGLTATVFVQLASIGGSVIGGFLADWVRARTPRGRILVQAGGVLCGAPCVALCGLTHSISWLIAALTAWGLFKGIYDANIFASLFDVVPEEARGTATGFMNSVGWLGGGGAAPLAIGIIAQSHGLGVGIAMASVVYVIACGLLVGSAYSSEVSGVTGSMSIQKIVPTK